MLVLSRRPNEKIVLPASNTTVQVVSIKPNAVRIGIDAPPDVEVFREELITSGSVTPRPAPVTVPATLLRELRHQIRNRLSAASVGLALLRRQIEVGPAAAAGDTLDKLEREFAALRDQTEAAVAQALPGTPAPAARKYHTALLVEDDQNERELLAGFLRLSGLEVVTAGDGCDALDYLRSHTSGPPDVVLLDMALPRCDGPTTLREMRREPALRSVKVFALTGHSPEEFDLDPRAAGIDRWFHKPLNPQALLHGLKDTLAE
jgi:carbon storage regulator CsrA